MRIVIVLCLLIVVALLANGPEGMPPAGSEACKIASQHVSAWFVPVCKF